MAVAIRKIFLAVSGACVGMSIAGFAQAAAYYDSGNYGYGGASRVVTCESRNQRTVYCNMDSRYGVRLYRQISSGSCVQGQTWGSSSRGVWVSGGCRAQFIATSDRNDGSYGDNGYGNDSYGDNGGYYDNGNGYDNGGNYGANGNGYGYDRVVRCESVNSGTTYCRTGSGDARIQRRLSQAACIEGRTWGQDRRGLWVSNGCRAEFRIGGNEYGNGYGNNVGNGYGNGYGYGYGRRLTCESRDGRYNFCRTGTQVRQAQIYRQLSSSRCQSNWGYRSDGIWVSNGCRAEFTVY